MAEPVSSNIGAVIIITMQPIDLPDDIKLQYAHLHESSMTMSVLHKERSVVVSCIISTCLFPNTLDMR